MDKNEIKEKETDSLSISQLPNQRPGFKGDFNWYLPQQKESMNTRLENSLNKTNSFLVQKQF